MGNYIGSSTSSQETLALLEAGHKTGVPIILWGSPGVGKTALINAIAQRNNLTQHILIASTMDPTDVNGLPAIKEIIIRRPDGEEENVTVTEPTLQYWSEALMREGKGILFFDEASNAAPAVQAALLSVLQGRLVGRHRLPNEVWMIAAANPADEAADGWELSAPMANRFLHVNYKPSLEDWYEGMTIAWGDEVSEAELMERFKVVQFIKTMPALWHNMPTDDASRGGAWPSPRTWNDVSRVLAHLQGPNSRGVRNIAVKGLVGEAAAAQFEAFEFTSNLPDYNLVIKAPDAIEWGSHTASEVLILLQIVAYRINAENAEASMKVLKAVTESGRQDTVIALTQLYIKKITESGAPLTSLPAFSQTLLGLIPYVKEAKIA